MFVCLYLGTKESVVLLCVFFFVVVVVVVVSLQTLSKIRAKFKPPMGDVPGFEFSRDSFEPVPTGLSTGVNPDRSVLFVRLDGTK